MDNDKIDTENIFNKFLTTYKRTHVNINGQQAQIECSIKWRELEKGRNNISTKSTAMEAESQTGRKRLYCKLFDAAVVRKEGMQYNLPGVE